MKAKSFLALLLSAATLLFSATSCSDDEDGSGAESTTNATSISLDQSTLTLAIDEYETLVATLEPTGATGTISWSSTDETVASVSDSGLVYALASGTTTIYATCGTLSATCDVTVAAADLHESLSGSDYYLVALDATTYESIADKVTADFRPDDVETFLYIWAGYEAGTASGVNAYGEVEDWTCLVVNATSSAAYWSGLGVCVAGDESASMDYASLDCLSAVTNAPDEYYLHFAMKSSQSGITHSIKMEDVGDHTITVGNAGGEDYNLPNDGEWYHFDVPMTTFTDNGFAFNSSHSASANVFIVLSGAVDGDTLDYDAVFFYKK